jgi:uncharacterized membrane protein YhhN
VIGVEFYVETYKSYEPFRFPVIIFLSVLTLLMSITAIRATGGDSKGYIFAITGAIFLFTSNAMLLLDIFVLSIPVAGSMILFAYMTGQYLIVDSIWRSISRLSPQVT